MFHVEHFIKEMIKVAKKGGLGMGLDALFDDNSNEVQAKQTVRVNDIEPNKSQPRTDFDEESIASLADSIRAHGLLQPLLVRPLTNGGYQIVAGERRWRACRMLGLSEIPVIIRELSDMETAQIALIENLQRENLNPIEQALGFKGLMDTYDMTQESVSKTVGKSRSTVANSLRLLNLPNEIQVMLRKGDITTGHAKALASISDEKLMLEVAEKAANGQITVRAIEKISAKADYDEEKQEIEKKDSYFTEMELGLRNELGRKVSVNFSKNKGTLVLEFYDKEDLSELAKKLTLAE